MQLIIANNYEDMSKKASKLLISRIKDTIPLNLGLATGSTPVGLYKELVTEYANGNLDFEHTRTFNLDEYIGLSPYNPNSYSYYMWKHFFSHINIRKENIHIPPGIFANEQKVIDDYEEAIVQAGGIDLQVLGIGANGHIGFNEPGESLSVSTHIVELKSETIKANSRFFENKDEVPKKAITMGMGKIMEAKEILLLASGKEKAKALAQTVKGIVETHCPSTILQIHPNVKIIADKEASFLIADRIRASNNCILFSSDRMEQYG
nr:glucosamine-6-phosphate deaminase [Thalassobacillus devorans]